MWNDSFDEREYLRDDLLIEADLMAEVQSASFWEGYREDELQLAERDVSYEDEWDWAAAA